MTEALDIVMQQFEKYKAEGDLDAQIACLTIANLIMTRLMESKNESI